MQPGWRALQSAAWNPAQHVASVTVAGVPQMLRRARRRVAAALTQASAAAPALPAVPAHWHAWWPAPSLTGCLLLETARSVTGCCSHGSTAPLCTGRRNRAVRGRHHRAACCRAAAATAAGVRCSSVSGDVMCGGGGCSGPAGPRLPRRARRHAARGCRAAGLALANQAVAPCAAPAAAFAAAAPGSEWGLGEAAAVALGYAVMAGSLFRSVPQIAKVLRHRSTEGLSLSSVVVELCCYSVTIAYNVAQGYGFSTFGEVVACWVQDVLLISLILRFSGAPVRVGVALGVGIAAGCGWLLSPACPAPLLAGLQATNIAALALGSRLPQILLNLRRGNAGVLSVTTCLLNVAGNAARVFTTAVLTGDWLLLGGYLSQGTLNSILLCQTIGTARATKTKRAAEHDTEPAGGAVGAAAAAAVAPQHPPLQPPPATGGLAMQPAV